MLMYTPYTHGQSNTTPYGCENDEIYGVEFEIVEINDYDNINYFIEDGKIETVNTEEAGVQLELEDDGNIEYELIFNADTKENLLYRIEELKDLSNDIETFEGSSCHIHMNRQYLKNIGLSEVDILKSTEAIAPFIYSISGRNEYYFERWSESYIAEEAVYNRFLEIDNLKPNYSTRYKLCNLTNDNTIEIRGFSSNYGFHKDILKLYLDTVSELIINIALEMKNKKYSRDYETVIKTVEKFINENETVLTSYGLFNTVKRIWEYNPQKIVEFKKEQIEEYYKQYELCNQYLARAKTANNRNETLYAAKTIIELMTIEEKIKIDIIDLTDLKNVIKSIETQIIQIFKEKIGGV